MIEEDRPTVIILRALGLGDLLTAVPALRALARKYRDHQRVLLTAGRLRPLVPLFRTDGIPCIDDVLPVDSLGFDPRRLPSHPEVAVNLHGAGPQSHRLLQRTGPSRLIAFASREAGLSGNRPSWRGDEHEVARWCRLLSESGTPADPGELEINRPILRSPDWAEGATLLHPGAASRSRQWPPDRWVTVARQELSRGREVVVTGSAAEIGLVRRIGRKAGIDPSRVVAGRTGPLSLAALVAAAGTVVCGDTGVAHLATALRRPSVLLFGPTPPDRWGPFIDRDLHRVIWTGKSGDPHSDDVDRGLLEIDTDTVLAALSDRGAAPI